MNMDTKKKKSKKIVVICLITILIIASIISFIVIRNNQKYSYKIEQIENKDAKYFVLIESGKCGVIDENGQVVITPAYYNVQIPNPTKPVFVCFSNYDAKTGIYATKVLNEKNEEIFTDYDSVETIMIKDITSNIPYEKSVLKYEENGKYGIMDFNGKKITDSEYDQIDNIDYKEGILRVKKDERYGAINIKGTVLIKPEYDDITSDNYYNENSKYKKAGFILKIRTDDGYKYGYADYNGKIIHDTLYNEIDRVIEIENDKDVYLVLYQNGKAALYKNKKQILNREFDEIHYDKDNNVFIARKNNYEGAFSIDGKPIIPIDYDSIVPAGQFLNAQKGEQILVFDSQGNEKSDNIISKKTTEDDKYYITIDKNYNYGVCDKNDSTILEGNYSYIEYAREDRFIVTKDGKTGIVNSNGRTLVEFEYSAIQTIDDTNAFQAIVNSTAMTYIISSDMKVSKSFANSYLTKKDGFLELFSENERTYFDKDGKETQYVNINPNNTLYAKEKDGKWGFVDKNGNTKVDYIYDMVTEQNGNVVGVKKDGKWGVLDLNGNTLQEPKYTISWINPEFLGVYYKVDNGVGLPSYSNDEKK